MKYLQLTLTILKIYKIEVSLILIALITGGVAIIGLVGNYSSHQDEAPKVQFNQTTPTSTGYKKKIFVDISGAVINPNSYEVTEGARLKDVLDLAGGVSTEVDKSYFNLNINLAQIIHDQEKIYIPTVEDISTGLFKGINNTTLQPSISEETKNTAKNDKINLNTASVDQLDGLPGIGAIKGQKIIENRPYKTLDELVKKNVLKNTDLTKIESLVTL